MPFMHLSFGKLEYQELFDSVLEAMIAYGQIRPDDMSNAEIIKAIGKVLGNHGWKVYEDGKPSEVEKATHKLHLTFTHEEDLRRSAMRAVKTKNRSKAALLYSTWFEHSVNHFLIVLAIRKGLKHKDACEMVRRLSMIHKTSWALDLLGTERPPKEVVSTFLRMEEHRNRFVHYKGLNVEDAPEYYESLDKLLPNVPQACRDWEGYIKKILFRGWTPRKLRKRLGISIVNKPNGGLRVVSSKA